MYMSMMTLVANVVDDEENAASSLLHRRTSRRSNNAVDIRVDTEQGKTYQIPKNISCGDDANKKKKRISVVHHYTKTSAAGIVLPVFIMPCDSMTPPRLAYVKVATPPHSALSSRDLKAAMMPFVPLPVLNSVLVLGVERIDVLNVYKIVVENGQTTLTLQNDNDDLLFLRAHPSSRQSSSSSSSLRGDSTVVYCIEARTSARVSDLRLHRWAKSNSQIVFCCLCSAFILNEEEDETYGQLAQSILLGLASAVVVMCLNNLLLPYFMGKYSMPKSWERTDRRETEPETAEAIKSYYSHHFGQRQYQKLIPLAWYINK
jgi:hypothetical protein